MQTRDSLYARVLIWAFEHDNVGFTRAELEQSLALTREEAVRVGQLFYFGTSDNPPLIDRVGERNGIDYQSLTKTGVAAAVDYLDLKEARESSKQAMAVAIISIIIGIVIGAAQIGIAIFKP